MHSIQTLYTDSTYRVRLNVYLCADDIYCKALADVCGCYSKISKNLYIARVVQYIGASMSPFKNIINYNRY